MLVSWPMRFFRFFRVGVCSSVRCRGASIIESYGELYGKDGTLLLGCCIGCGGPRGVGLILGKTRRLRGQNKPNVEFL